MINRLRLALLAAPLALGLAANAQAAQDARVKLQTNFGPIVVQTNAARAPKTVENFLRYVKEGHFNGTIFHRVIAGFMIQGGGFTQDMKEKPTHAPIPLEARGGLKNDKYTIAMARTSYPHSATSQFFINVADNDFLNAAPGNDGYAVFGKVVEGFETVDKIAEVRTGSGPYGMRDVPVEPVVIEKAEILR